VADAVSAGAFEGRDSSNSPHADQAALRISFYLDSQQEHLQKHDAAQQEKRSVSRRDAGHGVQ
jgi:hypothetical protein